MLSGLVVGGLLGELAKTVDWLWWLSYGEEFGLSDPISLDLKVLKLSPSNLEAMEELVRMYEVLGDAEKVEKYTKKIGVIKGNMELDRLEKMKEKNINFS